ncbi:hypothetical protein VE01_07533 [Pseudogymnoascus verrucosus]|uniref:Uncharacterized protein n=1 Tax=Pseudogymnoascus verrucosus TaxID=342668 RepID=A0A1B8GGN4_9PEZI|nr:uncharacterized protein VE01_07533 [Pseudogymnoascus verrucosus]OBT95009.1 hypothetical protein VE01_07533 [Pseudogymnoascus verrucosus]
MDAAEDDRDIKLQKLSSTFIADFELSLQPFLYRTTADGTAKVRRNVRAREADRLVGLLEPFQELPQLLDPHLGRFLPVLADALLAYLRAPPLKKGVERPQLVTLSQAICRLLYTFCKIRGEKVVVRFFGAETRNLELLLNTVEDAERSEETGKGDEEVKEWTWEERYICLLWLSHLLLAPFDLSTISSAGTGDAKRPEIANLVWPEKLPSVAERAIPLAIKYLGAAGKERDAAKALLVRISMRRDMQALALLDALVQWAMACLKSSTTLASNSSYYYIGVLSYLAGILISSLSTADMDPYLLKVFRTVQNISDEENVAFKIVHASAIARKTVIKVLRTIAVLALRREYSSKGNEVITNEIVESTVGYLLDALADNDTPVRLAASKALSVITLKLAPDLASQVVSAVLESLTTNILWTTLPDGTKTQDLTAVNPQEWHGLILTLSHLLYRKSPPPDSLALILHALLTGLTFERRSTSGSSVGTNVRDAACFGIWALARRYTTRELQDVVTAEVGAATAHTGEKSIIQILATELVVAASYDSAGNIRRGASAALQELIGRHPDIVTEGIAVVQVVDYHAVALRSRAILEVAPAAARLGDCYADALMRALFGWRGVGSGDAKSRRTVAGGVGELVKLFAGSGKEKPWRRVQELIEQIDRQLGNLKPRAIDERHGLVLVMAAAAGALPALLDANSAKEWEDLLDAVKAILRVVLSTLKSAMASTSRRPELGLEATCRLIVAACPIIRMERVLGHAGIDIVAWEKILHNKTSLKCIPDDSFDSTEVREIVGTSGSLIDASLRLTDLDTIEAAVAAATSLTLIIPTAASESLIHSWAVAVTDHSSRTRHPGYLFVLASVFTHTQSQDAICALILGQWQQATNIVDRVSILQCLNRAQILDSHTARFIPLIAEGLDDYTTDARGDIGSLARIEALKATSKAFATIPCDAQSGAMVQDGNEDWFADEDLFGSLYSRTLRLAAEKLDKVRGEAQTALAILIQDPIQHAAFTSSQHATRVYFRHLLDLQLPSSVSWLSTASIHPHQRWTAHLFDGYVSAADSGAEGLIRASRAALNDFCFAAPANRELVCNALVGSVKRLHDAGDERVLLPAMSVVAFLFDVGILEGGEKGLRGLFLATQRAHFKSGSVRKLEVAVRVYGGLLGVGEEEREVEKVLVRMLRHPFPGVRKAVEDVLWVGRGVGKGGVGVQGVKKALEEKWESGGE